MKEVLYKVKIVNCPHCGINIQQEFQSCISKKLAIDYMFRSIRLHTVDVCKPKKPKMIKVELTENTKYWGDPNKVDVKVEYQKVII